MSSSGVMCFGFCGHSQTPVTGSWTNAIENPLSI